jgi:anti-anti-sigma regulatory factor
MLRVTVNQDHGEFVTLKLEGKLSGARVLELSRVWQSLEPSLGSRKLSVDLRDVTFADSKGIQALAEIYSRTGAAFLADTPLTKYFAEEAVQGIRSNLI